MLATTCKGLKGYIAKQKEVELRIAAVEDAREISLTSLVAVIVTATRNDHNCPLFILFSPLSSLKNRPTVKTRQSATQESIQDGQIRKICHQARNCNCRRKGNISIHHGHHPAQPPPNPNPSKASPKSQKTTLFFMQKNRTKSAIIDENATIEHANPQFTNVQKYQLHSTINAS